MAVTTPYLPLYGTMAIIAGAFLVIGFIDDRRHLRPMVRLVLASMICLAALQAVPAYGVAFFKFTFIPETLFLDGWRAFFSILCLVGLQNAVNMADGKNGLVPGLCLIWSLLIAAYAPAHLLPVVTVLIAVLVVVLAFNLADRLFLGDSGCYAISILVGLLAIHTHYINFARLPADVVALWFLIPVVDCVRLMFGRVLAGRSPFDADRNHLHHYLSAMMPWRWGLLVYLAMVAVPALLAYARPDYTALWGVLAFSCYSVILGLRVRVSRTDRLTSI